MSVLGIILFLSESCFYFHISVILLNYGKLSLWFLPPPQMSKTWCFIMKFMERWDLLDGKSLCSEREQETHLVTLALPCFHRFLHVSFCTFFPSLVWLFYRGKSNEQRFLLLLYLFISLFSLAVWFFFFKEKILGKVHINVFLLILNHFVAFIF